MPPIAPLADEHASVRWAKVVDQTKCIGCHACSTACKSENLVPLGVFRTYVKSADVGTFPNARRAFQVTRCNQCTNAPCTTICPTAAMFTRKDGIVDFDKDACIGCKACIAACPYDAIFINPEDGSAEKCNFCAHRLDVGLEPACVTVCPTEAILVGDLNDASTRVAQITGRDATSVRRPEKGTAPKLFYKGAHQATLDPLAATRPLGGLFAWSEQGSRADSAAGLSTGVNSAAALLSYDVPHQVPWHGLVSLYTWTKGIAAGAFLVPALLFLTGDISETSTTWRYLPSLLGGLFLAITGALLLADLEHPRRFYLMFTRPQWRSWLVRGALLLTGYAAVLAAHFVAAFSGNDRLLPFLVVGGTPLALGSAIYTAYLFAQASARDLWQSPILAPHFALQSLLVGTAALLPIAAGVDPDAVPALDVLLALMVLANLILVAGEISFAHPTAHAKLAMREMTSGRFAKYFWPGVLLPLAGLAAPWIGWSAAIPVLLGVLAYEHAYVQAGQSVPLA